MTWSTRVSVAVLGALVWALPCRAEAPAASKPIEKGQRVFSAGHSFHMFVPNILRDIAAKAGIKDHVQSGTSSIGGSRTIQHWNLAEEKNNGKKALTEGKTDVMTLSPIFHPDPGVDNFAELGLKHNPDLRITVQAFWLPYDVYDPNYQKKRPEKQDRNSRSVSDLWTMHAPYFTSVDDQVKALNKKHGKTFMYVVPTGQAVILLREKIIAGQAPGIKTQDELFTDAIGHCKAPVQVLAAYCHFAVIYRRSPVGLPMPAALGGGAKGVTYDEKLNKLLQELAWEAVTKHPLSGVTAAAANPGK